MIFLTEAKTSSHKFSPRGTEKLVTIVSCIRSSTLRVGDRSKKILLRKLFVALRKKYFFFLKKKNIYFFRRPTKVYFHKFLLLYQKIFFLVDLQKLIRKFLLLYQKIFFFLVATIF